MVRDRSAVLVLPPLTEGPKPTKPGRRRQRQPPRGSVQRVSNASTLLYGVPPDLDLAPFQDAMLERLDLGIHILHFRFATAEPEAVISVEGDWELRDAAGQLLDRRMEPGERDVLRLHVLVGRTVVATRVHPPEFFSLRFDSGHTLHVFDSSREYESFQIEPGGIIV